MSRKPSKTIEEQIFEAKLKVIEAYEDYETQLYFETMPDIDPLYDYSYQTSNLTIPGEHQNIDAWLRAVMKHMALRIPGHGGAKTDAVLVSINKDLEERYRKLWLKYETRKIVKRATRRKKPAK